MDVETLEALERQKREVYLTNAEIIQMREKHYEYSRVLYKIKYYNN